MTTDLEAAVARLKRDLDAIAAETSGAKEARGDVRLLLADWERLRTEESGWKEGYDNLRREKWQEEDLRLRGDIRHSEQMNDALEQLRQEEHQRTTAEQERDAARAEVGRLSVQVAASAQGPLHELLGMCGGVDRCDFCGRIGPHVAGCKAPAIEALVRLAWVDVPDWDRWWSPADYADHEAELARLRERDAKVREKVLTMLNGPSLCSAKKCRGHCGFVHLRGCAAIKDWCATEWAEERALLKETP